MDKKLRLKILQYLATHNTLTLATTDGHKPWAAALYYVNKGFTLYFLSKPRSLHCQHLKIQPAVSATVNEDYKNWTEIRGIQLEGRACPVTDNIERTRAMALYLKKYPFVKNFYATANLKQALLSVKLYKIVPETICFIDNSGGYFNRQKIKV